MRILSKTKKHESGYDANLSYGVLNMFIKYPIASTAFESKHEDIKKHKFGYYYAERETTDEVCSETGIKQNDGYVCHPLADLYGSGG